MEQPHVLNSKERELCAGIDTIQTCTDRVRALVVAVYVVLDSDAHHRHAMTLASMAEEEVNTINDYLESLYDTVRTQTQEATQGVTEGDSQTALDFGDEHQPW